MGILGTIFNELTKSETEISAEAMLDAMCLAAASDGDVDDDELDNVLELAMDLEHFRGQDEAAVAELITESFARLEDDDDMEVSLERIAESVEGKDGRRQVFYLIALVQELDGEVTEDEDALLELAAEALDISKKQAKRILEDVAEAIEELDGGDDDDDDGDYDEGDDVEAAPPMKRVWPSECKGCGADIEMPAEDQDVVACRYCGMKFPVELELIK